MDKIIFNRGSDHLSKLIYEASPNLETIAKINQLFEESDDLFFNLGAKASFALLEKGWVVFGKESSHLKGGTFFSIGLDNLLVAQMDNTSFFEALGRKKYDLALKYLHKHEDFLDESLTQTVSTWIKNLDVNTLSDKTLEFCLEAMYHLEIPVDTCEVFTEMLIKKKRPLFITPETFIGTVIQSKNKELCNYLFNDCHLPQKYQVILEKWGQSLGVDNSKILLLDGDLLELVTLEGVEEVDFFLTIYFRFFDDNFQLLGKVIGASNDLGVILDKITDKGFTHQEVLHALFHVENFSKKHLETACSVWGEPLFLDALMDGKDYAVSFRCWKALLAIVEWLQAHQLSIDVSFVLSIIDSNPPLEVVQTMIALLGREWINAESHGSTPFLRALVCGSSDVITYLHSQGGNLDSCNSIGWNVLHHYLFNPNLDPVWLQKLKKYEGGKDHQDFAPVHLAAAEGEWKSVLRLQAEGFDVGLVNQAQLNFAEIFCCQRVLRASDFQEVSREFLALMEHYILNKPEGSLNLLHHLTSIQEGCLDPLFHTFKELPLLLSKKDSLGQTPFELALCKKNQAVFASYLPFITVKDFEQVGINNQSLLHTLFDQKLDPLYYHWLYTQFPEKVKKKIKVLFDIKNGQGQTPLHLAAKARLLPFLAWVQQGNFLDQDKDGNTPLHLYFKGKNGVYYHDLMVALISQYLGQNLLLLEDYLGETLPFLLLKSGHISLLAFCLDHVPVNHQNKLGNTLLHLSILEKDHESFTLLLSRNPNFFLSNSHGKNPLDLLIESKNKQLITFFLKSVYTSNESIEYLLKHADLSLFHNFIQLDGATILYLKQALIRKLQEQHLYLEEVKDLFDNYASLSQLLQVQIEQVEKLSSLEEVYFFAKSFLDENYDKKQFHYLAKGCPLTPNHYQVQKIAVVPQLEDTSRWPLLLEHFDRLFPDVYLYDGKTKQDLRQKLESLFEYVAQDKPFKSVPGDSEQRVEWYKNIKNILANLERLMVASDDEDKGKACLLDLALYGPMDGFCGTRWESEARFHFFNWESATIEQGVVEWVKERAFSLRKNIFLQVSQEINQNYSVVGNEVHTLARHVHLVGQSLGVAFEEIEPKDDPYGAQVPREDPELPQEDWDMICFFTSFGKKYHVDALIKSLMDEINGPHLSALERHKIQDWVIENGIGKIDEEEYQNIRLNAKHFRLSEHAKEARDIRLALQRLCISMEEEVIKKAIHEQVSDEVFSDLLVHRVNKEQGQLFLQSLLKEGEFVANGVQAFSYQRKSFDHSSQEIVPVVNYKDRLGLELLKGAGVV